MIRISALASKMAASKVVASMAAASRAKATKAKANKAKANKAVASKVVANNAAASGAADKPALSPVTAGEVARRLVCHDRKDQLFKMPVLGDGFGRCTPPPSGERIDLSSPS
jgi:hypothetical protein